MADFSNALAKATDGIKARFEIEIAEKASFVQKMCADNVCLEDIGLAMFEAELTQSEIEHTFATYLEPKTTDHQLDLTISVPYLEKKVLRVASPSFNKNSVGWNRSRTKEQQLEFAIENLGRSLNIQTVLDEENVSGVMLVPIKIVVFLLKKISQDFENKSHTENVTFIKNKFDDLITYYKTVLTPSTDLEKIRYKALLADEENMRALLIADIDNTVVRMTCGLFASEEFSTSIIHSLISEIINEWNNSYFCINIAKTTFHKLCALYVRKS